MTAKLNVNFGEQFGRLSILSEIYKSSPRKFLCLCVCGAIYEVFLSNLRSGHTTSCGCLVAEKAFDRNRTHGKSFSKVYKSWLSIKERCFVTTRDSYKDYGGRGVSMEEDWKNSFESFYEFIGDPPDDRKWSIERLDVDDGYFPHNIKWALPDTQNRNRRKFKNNTSGATGVTRRVRNGAVRFVAIWIERNGKEGSKSFSVKNYGDAAYDLACKYREDQINRLRDEGADYSEKHGR